MHQYAPSNTKSQRGLNSNDYNILAETGIITSFSITPIKLNYNNKLVISSIYGNWIEFG